MPRVSINARRAIIALVVCMGGCAADARQGSALPTTQEVIASKTDLWGEAALREPNGPSYEFFEKLLPPLRYVDADFRCYPIVLSAPGATVKGRVVSDGSAINALARQPNWKNEMGTPIRIVVGQRREPFGKDLTKLNGPKLVDGYLPIVRFAYEQEGEPYTYEIFSGVDERSPGAIHVRFDFPAAGKGRIELRIEQGGNEFLPEGSHLVSDHLGRPLIACDDNWEFQKFRSALASKNNHAASATVTIFTHPVGAAPVSPSSGPANRPVVEEEAGETRKDAAASPQVTLDNYGAQRARAVDRWNSLLSIGTQIIVPEPYVNNAWRNLILQQYQLIANKQLNYSAGNQYARQYANESGDTMRSLVFYNHFTPAREGLRPLFVYRRPGIELHDGGFKLEDLADYYFVTRDAQTIREMRPLWQKEVDLLLGARQKDTRLFPRERYCSDIDTPVLSLNNNANAWRGLRDMAIVLADIGENDEAARLASAAEEYRSVILLAMEKSIFRNVDPPFVPVAMGGEETPPSPITSTRIGSYWNLVIPCVLWSGIVPIDSEPCTAIVRYIRENGGLCMGMTRVQSNPTFWINIQNIDDLYLIRYALALLKRDEVDHALVGFYGKLAQGMTRDTFYDGESTSIVPLDEHGRQIALPPNSTANASFLMQLRYLLVQDWDMDSDGHYETLRLNYATPRPWLADGKTISIDRAPTAFGEVSYSIKSDLAHNKIEASVKLPPRKPKQTLIRFRVHEGYRVIGATHTSPLQMIAPETFDISALTGDIRISVQTEKAR